MDLDVKGGDDAAAVGQANEGTLAGDVETDPDTKAGTLLQLGALILWDMHVARRPEAVQDAGIEVATRRLPPRDLSSRRVRHDAAEKSGVS